MTAEFASALSSVAGDIQAVIDITMAATEPNALDPTQLYGRVVPAGARHEVLDLQQYLAAPRRKVGTTVLNIAESFSGYVVTHDDGSGHCSLYADVETGRVWAVLNGHSEGEAGWGDHRALLQLRHPPAWKRWAERDRQLNGQTAFAEHIEEGLDEIVSPPGAEMLELAQSFQANTKVAFRSARLLDSGQRQLVYEETIEASAGQRGQITIPATFELALTPYEGCEAYRVIARLRYRITDGKLSIGYVLDRPEEVLRTAFDDILASIETATGLTAYRGTPGVG